MRVQFENLKLLTRSSVAVNYTGQKMSCYLDNMRPWSVYLIKLFPFNEAGKGKCSLEKSIETPPIRKICLLRISRIKPGYLIH